MAAKVVNRKRVENGKGGQTIVCPFTVQIDTAEQKPYVFSGLKTNADKGAKLLEIPIERKHLETGDYSILGWDDRIVIERKSKSDFFGSVADRENFEDRLERMERIIEAGGYACVMVEAHMMDCLMDPPPYSKLRPKSLARTIMAWDQRFKASWWFIQGREHAEAFTFRLLERFWLDHHQDSNHNESRSRHEVSE